MFKKSTLTNPDSRSLTAIHSDARSDLFLHPKLIAIAKTLRATTKQQAHGTCLTMSLEFCYHVKKLNISTSLVMWHVKGDPLFYDHWAVRINQTQVVDLTRIQIEPTLTSKVVFDLSDYPSNFSQPRFYITEPLLAEYLDFKMTYSEKLPPILIKNLRSLMLKQDLYDANHFKNFSGIRAALFSYLKFRFTFWLSQLEERLQKRLNEITKR